MYSIQFKVLSLPFKVFGVNDAKSEQSFNRSEISKIKLFYYFNNTAKRKLMVTIDPELHGKECKIDPTRRLLQNMFGY